MIFIIIAIGVIAAIIDRYTGNHLKKLTTWQLFQIFFTLLLIGSMVTDKS